jgi:hypothetical protein
VDAPGSTIGSRVPVSSENAISGAPSASVVKTSETARV